MWASQAVCLYLAARLAERDSDDAYASLQQAYEHAQAQADAAPELPCEPALIKLEQVVRGLGARVSRADRAPAGAEIGI